MSKHRSVLQITGTLLGVLLSLDGLAFQTFADEDRSADLSTRPAHQKYQFNTPTTVTYDRDTLSGTASQARVYVADMGNHRIQVLGLDGQQTGRLDDADQLIASGSGYTFVFSLISNRITRFSWNELNQ